MNFKENVSLKQYSDEANRQFGDLRKQLQTLSTEFKAKMGGKTLAQTIGSMVGTGLWMVFILAGTIMLIVFGERFFYYANINIIFGVIVAVLFLVLFIFMLIDEYTDYSFCKKIDDYQSVVTGLEKRLISGSGSIQENGKAFAYAETLGYNYTLTKTASIQEESGKIGEKVRGIASLKEGFITEAKNVMYYVAAGGMTLFGLVSLFETAGFACYRTFHVIDFTNSEWESFWYYIVLFVAIVAVVVGEVLLLRYAWSKSNCKVTNTTVFATLAGAAAFVPLSMLLTAALYFAIVLLVVAICIGIFYLIGVCITGAASG